MNSRQFLIRDLLVLFDAAPFEEEIRRNQALLAQAEAEVLKAREDLKLQAIQNQDLPMIMGTVLFSGTLVIAANLVVDLAYGWIDPRIKDAY